MSLIYIRQLIGQELHELSTALVEVKSDKELTEAETLSEITVLYLKELIKTYDNLKRVRMCD